jgi:hypothetical protein
MKDCIFCRKVLDYSTRPEHILLDCFGGRKTTNRVICSDCNNTFGNGIDKEIAQQVSVIRNMLQLPSGTGNAAPMLRNVKAGADTLNILGDGKIDLINKPFSITERADGKFEVKINARSFEHMEKLIPRIAAALKMPEDHFREQIVQAHALKVERRPDPIKFSLSFGGTLAIRSAAKSCLILWATLVGNDEIESPCYDAVRHYIFSGDDNFHTKRTHLDSRFFDNIEAIKDKYGPAFNLIYVRSNADGRVIGHFTMYNLIAFQIILAENGGSPDRQIALVSNPLNPAVWSDEAATEFDIPFTWLDAPDYSDELTRSRARVEAIMEYYFKVMNPKRFDQICEDVFKKYGIEEGQRIPGELSHQISNEIVQRVIKNYYNIPHEEEITAAQMQVLFAKKLPNENSK